MRICENCKLEKDEDDFYPSGKPYKGKVYLRKMCKTCTHSLSNAYQKTYRTLNKEKVLANARTWRKAKYMTDEEYRKRTRRQEAERRPRYKVKNMWDKARFRAREKGWEFTLKLEDIIIPEICPLLEIPIFCGTKGDYKNSPSLDRIDNSKGYTKQNVRVISSLANTMKNSSSLENLTTFCKNIPKYIDFDDIVQPNEK